MSALLRQFFPLRRVAAATAMLLLGCGGTKGEARDATDDQESTQPTEEPSGEEADETDSTDDDVTVERKRVDDYPGLW